MTSRNIFGGNGDDLIIGNAATNLISGGGGKDTIKGGDGNDKLIGSRDHDMVLGQGGVNLYSILDAGADDFDGVLDTSGRAAGTFVSGDLGLDFSIVSKTFLQ